MRYLMIPVLFFSISMVLAMEDNLARKGYATASENLENASKSIDGNIRTHWSSRQRDRQWIMVDLGTIRKVGCIIIYWQTCFAEDFSIQVSKDGKSFREVAKTDNGTGGIDAFGFSTEETRFIRIHLEKPGTKWQSYGIYEIEIYEQ